MQADEPKPGEKWIWGYNVYEIDNISMAVGGLRPKLGQDHRIVLYRTDPDGYLLARRLTEFLKLFKRIDNANKGKTDL